jgi:hypothetical protein
VSPGGGTFTFALHHRSKALPGASAGVDAAIDTKAREALEGADRLDGTRRTRRT